MKVPGSKAEIVMKQFIAQFTESKDIRNFHYRNQQLQSDQSI